MEPKFKAKYEETKEVLVALCELFHVDKGQMTLLYTVFLLGPVVLIFMFKYGHPGAGPGGPLFFAVKFLCAWAAGMFAADIAGRTMIRSMQKSAAIGDGEELYRLRISKRNEPLYVSVEFYDDKIVNDTGARQAVFLYKKITKLLESDKAIGFLADNGPGPKRFFGVPKDALEDADVEELKQFLLEKCDRVKKFKLI